MLVIISEQTVACLSIKNWDKRTFADPLKNFQSSLHTQTHIHAHTYPSKDEQRLVRASYWAVLSDYLCMANPPDTPWEAIIHKRGGSRITITLHVVHVYQ